MILGVGNDIIEVSRIRSVLERHGRRFCERLLTKEEIAYCLSKSDPTFSVAGRFAAKEAIAKALGTGIGKELSWLDIEILNDSAGRPCAHFSGRANSHFSYPSISLSISHGKLFATAVAIWSK